MAEINEVFDGIKANLEAAIARETQIRTTYETSLIPDLQRDLEATRNDLIETKAERDALLSWKKRADAALVLVERAHVLTTEALDVAPGDAPLG